MNPFSPEPVLDAQRLHTFVEGHSSWYKEAFHGDISHVPLVLFKLDRPTKVVNHYQKNGVIGCEEGTLPPGTLVWGTPTGVPVLKAACLNPLRCSVPPLIHTGSVPSNSISVPEPSPALLLLVLVCGIIWLRIRRRGS